MVQGHSWQIHYFVEKGDPLQDGHIMYDGPMIGSTDSALGVYKLVAGIQRLMAWTELTYRPWYTENILDPKLAAIRSTVPRSTMPATQPT